MTKTDRYIKRQTARKVVKTVQGDLTQLISDADGETVAVSVVKLEQMEQALKNAAVSLIGT